MRIKKQLCLSRVLLFITIFSIIDQPWLEKTRATIAEEVAVVGLASAGIMRAVACAGAALYRAFTQRDNSKHNHTATQNVHAGKQDISNNYITPVLPTSSRIISENRCRQTIVPTHPSSIPTATANTLTTNNTMLNANSAVIARSYVDALSERDKSIAKQAKRSIMADWNNHIQTDTVRDMRLTNYSANSIVLDIERWTKSSYAITTQPGGGAIHFGDGFGHLRLASATHYKADRTTILQAFNIEEERRAINHDQQLYSHVKQLIYNFIENGRKLVYGSESERMIALLNLPYFYFPGISYGQELACAQQELYAHYYHEDDGSICLNALENTKAAQKILRNYRGINGSHKHLFSGYCSSEFNVSCDKPNAIHWVGRLPEDMASRIVDCEDNKKLIRIVQACASGDIAEATKVYHENSTGVRGATILFDAFRESYEVAVQKQEALLKDQYGIYHFGMSAEQRDPVFSHLSRQERQQLKNDTYQLTALNNFLVTRNYAKNTLHNLWRVPTTVSPAVHRALYQLLDTYTPESRIAKIYEFSQDNALSEKQKEEIASALHLPNGIIKDFADYDNTKNLNIPAIILLPEHAYTRKILNYLVYTKQTSKDEVIRQASTNAIERIQNLLQQKIETCQFACDWQELEQTQQEQIAIEQCIQASAAQLCDHINAYKKAIENNECDEEVTILWTKRVQAMEQTISDNYVCNMIPPIEPPDIIVQLLKVCQHIKDTLTNGNLTAIQRCIQQEIVEIMSKIADVCHGQHNILLRTIHELLHVATDFNRAGYIYKALITTDCCWMLLKCLPEMAMGIHDGVDDLLSISINAAKNPKSTVVAAKRNMKNAAWHLGKLLYEICGITVQCTMNEQEGWNRAKTACRTIYCVTKNLMSKMAEMPVREKTRFATTELIKSVITKKCISTLLRFYSTAGNTLERCMKIDTNSPKPPMLTPFPPMVALAECAADRASIVASVGATAIVTEGPSVTMAATKLPRKITYVLHNEQGLINVFNRHNNLIPLKKRYADIMGISHLKITPKYLKHVSGIQVTETFKKSGIVKSTIGGFHAYRKNKMRKYLRNVEIHSMTGVVKADIHYGGIAKDNNTFFPSSWSDDKMLRKVKEAITNPIVEPVMQKSGRWLLTGVTREKIKIGIVIEKTGELITTYPLFEL